MEKILNKKVVVKSFLKSKLRWSFILLCSSGLISCDQNQLKTDSLPQDGLNFLVIGDWGRDGGYDQRKVARQLGKVAEQMNASFIISTGDNFYSTGVKNVTDAHWKKSFENIYDHASLQKPWYVVLGNHDYTSNIQAQIDYTKISSRWTLPARYYSITKEVDEVTNAQFVFLDTFPFLDGSYTKARNLVKIAETDTSEQLSWLKRTFEKTEANWKIVIGHAPIYSASQVHGNTPRMIAQVKPILEKHAVVAYFCGHDHDLQHLKGDGPVNYFVSGAGSRFRKTDSNEMSLFSKGASGFIAVNLTPDQMKVFFIDIKGNIIYKATIKN